MTRTGSAPIQKVGALVIASVTGTYRIRSLALADLIVDGIRAN
ncbi:hypothetical protein [Arthrobacter sp. B1I2]|nr:hypothetical protein [Arthrobacter sp. B1I2]MDQ0733327.1 hypothetical protein [Arthrobacter sp. B1I2]